MKENEKPRRTIYDLVRDDLIERHPRILNLLMGFILVTLSVAAIFLASDIVSSGSHAIDKDGLGGKIFQLPKETFSALNNWRTEAFVDLVKTNGTNGSSETLEERTAIGNVSPSGTALSTNSSPEEPAIVSQRTPGTINAITASSTGSTNGPTAPVAKRHKSSGGETKKPKVNESQLSKTQENESQFNKSQLNAPVLNESKSDSPPSNDSQLSQPLAVVDSLQNASSQYASQPDSSKTNQSESANQSQKKESQAGQGNLTNKSLLSDSQSGIVEPMKEPQSNGLSPDQSMNLNKTVGETRMPPQAEAAVNNDKADSGHLAPADGGKPLVESSIGASAAAQSGASSIESSTMNSEAKAVGAPTESVAEEINPTSALADHQETPAGQNIVEGSSVQGDLQTGSSSSPLPGAVSNADAVKGGDVPVIKALKFDSTQENNGNNVSPDTSGTTSKTVLESKSSEEINNERRDEAPKQNRPARAPRKLAPQRQARSVPHR